MNENAGALPVEAETAGWGLEWLIGGSSASRNESTDVAALLQVPVVAANDGKASEPDTVLFVARSTLIREMAHWPEPQKGLILGLLEPHRTFREKNRRLASHPEMEGISGDRLREIRRELLIEAARLLIQAAPEIVPDESPRRWRDEPPGRIFAVVGVLFAAVLSIYLTAASANTWWPASDGGLWPFGSEEDSASGGSTTEAAGASSVTSDDGTTTEPMVASDMDAESRSDESETPLVVRVLGETPLALRMRPDTNDQRPLRVEVGSRVELLCHTTGQLVMLDSNDPGSDLWHYVRSVDDPSLEGFATDVFLSTVGAPAELEASCPPSPTEEWTELEVNEQQGETLTVEGVGIYLDPVWAPGTEIGVALHTKQVLAECTIEAETISNGADYASSVWLRVSVDGVVGWMPDAWVSRGEHALEPCFS